MMVMAAQADAMRVRGIISLFVSCLLRKLQALRRPGRFALPAPSPLLASICWDLEDNGLRKKFDD